MPRVKTGPASHQRRKKILKLAKGYRGSQSKRFRSAKEAVLKAGRHAYRDRRRKKRDFRGLWIQRINAAARLHGLPYNQFIHGLSKAGIKLDRKMLADIAVNEPATFSVLAQKVKSTLKTLY